MPLTHDDLLHGGVYAVEQAGLLLHDAISFYRDRRYSSAVALAVFCREELGRAQILFELRREALKSGPMNANRVITKCRDHIGKLQRGKAATMFTWGPEQANRFKGLMANPQGEEYKKARALVDQAVKEKRKREPQVAHMARLRSLFVEPNEGGDWNRPKQLTEAECRQFLADVANDYALGRDQLQNNPDLELERAIAEWKERPDPPRPVWPND